MRITGWDTEGFGHFKDFQVEAIPPGISVFLGPNEAGKSTLLGFIRTMLFGFKGAERQFPPLHGGRHGGRLFLQDPDGNDYTIERFLDGKKTSTRVIAADGSEVPESVIGQLLGGCDKTLFEAVFAFDLFQLQSLSVLDEEGIRNQIFSAGIVGAGSDARQAMQTLRSRQAELLKPRAGARINNLLVALKETQQKIDAAQRSSHGYDAALQAEARATERKRDIEQQIGVLRETKGRTDLLLDLWPTYLEQRGAGAELDDLEQTAPPPLDPAAVSQIKVLLDQRELYRANIDRLSEAQERRRTSVAALNDRLRDFGPDWTRVTLAAFDRSIPAADLVRGFESQFEQQEAMLNRSDHAWTEAKRRLTETEQAHLRLQGERDALGSPPTEEELAERTQDLIQLRAGLQEHANAVQRRSAAETELARAEEFARQATQSAAGAIPGWLSPALFAAAVALAALGVWRGLSEDMTGLVAALLAGVVALGAGLVVKQRSEGLERIAQDGRAAIAKQQEAAVTRLTAEQEAARTIEATIAGHAASLGLSQLPSIRDVEVAGVSIGQRQQARRDYDAKTRDVQIAEHQVEARATEVANAWTARTAAQTAYEKTLNEWADWKRSAGVPPDISLPASVETFFGAIASARQLLLTTEESERVAQRVETAVQDYERRVRQICVELGVTDAGVPVENAVELLHDRLDREIETDRRRIGLKQTIARCQARIERQLGAGPGVDVLLAEIAAGNREGWEAEGAAATSRIAELEAEREAATRALHDAENARHVIETSADLPRLELEAGQFREELQAAVREWRIATLAEHLVEQTLGIYQRERQPAVLEHASRLFARITDGRYERIVQEGQELHVLDSRNARYGVNVLSRGTQEQLYLCLRLGLATEFGRRTTQLPLVMDDILVNFDPERAAAVADVLCEFAGEHQVLLFTCHPTTVDLVRGAEPGCRSFSMRRFGGGGAWAEAESIKPPVVTPHAGAAVTA